MSGALSHSRAVASRALTGTRLVLRGVAAGRRTKLGPPFLSRGEDTLMANEKQRDPRAGAPNQAANATGRARVPAEAAGEDETSAKEYDEQRGGEGRTAGASAKNPPSAGRRQPATHASKTEGANKAALPVDEDVEPETESDADARKGDVGEQTETRKSPGPRAAGANPDVF